jgi:hypothetical protein
MGSFSLIQEHEGMHGVGVPDEPYQRILTSQRPDAQPIGARAIGNCKCRS